MAEQRYKEGKRRNPEANALMYSVAGVADPGSSPSGLSEAGYIFAD